MKILQLISSNGFFGAENMLFQLSLELKKESNVRLVVGVFKNPDNHHIEVAEEYGRAGIETALFPCNGRMDFRTLYLLRAFIKERKINIVHSHGYKSDLYSFFACRGLAVSLFSTCHNWLGDDFKMKGYAWLDRLVLRWFDRTVVVSNEVKQKIIQSGISEKRVRLISNGVNTELFEAECSIEKIRNDLGIDHDDIVIGTVGRISPEKNHRILLEISKAIRVRYPKTRFLIIGDGPLKKSLEAEYRSQSVIFTGLRKDVGNLYRCMDLFVLPSLTEGLPMVLLEAMASKLPVVATRVGKVGDVVVDGETGLLVTPGDETGLLKAISFLLNNMIEARKMGEKGKWRIKKCFSADRMSRAYLELYGEAFDR